MTQITKKAAVFTGSFFCLKSYIPYFRSDILFVGNAYSF